MTAALGNVYKYCIEIFDNKHARRLGVPFNPLGIHQPLLRTEVTFHI